MIQRPKFKSHFSVQVLQPDLVFLLHETGCSVLHGPLFPLLAPLINGQNEVADMARRLKGRATMVDVQFGLSWLEEDGYIVETAPLQPPELAAFCERLNIAPSVVQSRLEATRSEERRVGKECRSRWSP